MSTNIKAIINTTLSLFYIDNQMDSDQCFPVVYYHLSEQPKLNFIIYSQRVRSVFL